MRSSRGQETGTLSSDEERRKMVLGILPYLFNVYKEARAYLSPPEVLSMALERYGSQGQRILNEREALSSALRSVRGLEMSYNEGVFAFRIDRDVALEAFGSFLKDLYRRDGSAGSPFAIAPYEEGSWYDAELRLPLKSVYAKLELRRLDSMEEARLVQKASDLGASELWMITSVDEDVSMSSRPAFVRDNVVLFGQVKRVGLPKIIRTILGEGHLVIVMEKDDGIHVAVAKADSGKA
jgi:hypothetical protein